jgi:hypothetical protein
MENNQLDQAVEIMERSYAVSAEASGADHPDVVSGVVLLNFAKARRGDGPNVVEPMRKAVSRQRQIGIPLQQIAQSRMYVAGALMYVGDKEQAFAEADATLTELEGQSSPCGRGIVSVLLQIGTIFSVAGGPRESLAYLERAFECTKTDSSAAPFAARIAGAISWSYRRLDDQENAERWRAIESSLRSNLP